MSKYIDAEKLKTEIEKKRKTLISEYNELAKYEVWRSANDNKIKIYTISDILSLISSLQQKQDMGEISDGYHTFNELYYYRMLYNAAFFNHLPKEWVHKSKKHHDGEECFGGGWFIVMANLPTGQISNHYELKDWDLFQIPEKEIADEWDGHTPQEAAKRIHEYLLGGQKEQKPVEYLDTDKVYIIMTKLIDLSYSMCIQINSDEFRLIYEIMRDVRDLLGSVEWSEEQTKGIENAIEGGNSLHQEYPKVDLVARLKHHLATTPKEQLEKEWKELESWGNIGPTVEEFLYGEQPEVDLEKFSEKIKTFQERYKHPEIVSIKGAMAFMARMFYQYPNAARMWYEQLPKVTMD